jgi:hypothetical protein
MTRFGAVEHEHTMPFDIPTTLHVTVRIGLEVLRISQVDVTVVMVTQCNALRDRQSPAQTIKEPVGLGLGLVGDVPGEDAQICVAVPCGSAPQGNRKTGGSVHIGSSGAGRNEVKVIHHDDLEELGMGCGGPGMIQ